MSTLAPFAYAPDGSVIVCTDGNELAKARQTEQLRNEIRDSIRRSVDRQMNKGNP